MGACGNAGSRKSGKESWALASCMPERVREKKNSVKTKTEQTKNAKNKPKEEKERKEKKKVGWVWEDQLKGEKYGEDMACVSRVCSPT